MAPVRPESPSLWGARTPTTLQLVRSVIVVRIVGSIVVRVLVVILVTGFSQFLFELLSHPFLVKFVGHMHHFYDFFDIVLALRGFGVENVTDNAFDVVVERLI